MSKAMMMAQKPDAGSNNDAMRAQASALLAVLGTRGQDDDRYPDIYRALETLAEHGASDHADVADTVHLLRAAPSADPAQWADELAIRFLKLRALPVAPVQILAGLVTGLIGDVAGADHPLIRPLVMSLALAGVASPLPFHNQHHTREVTVLALVLGLVHDKQTPFAGRATVLAELAMAAAIHDYAHDGQGNRRLGSHSPMRLEQRALDGAMPYLKLAGLSDTGAQRITAMVLATDVSKASPHDVSPAEWLRRACAGGSPDGCPDTFRSLFSDATLALQAALLEDGDLGTSAGLPYAYARRMTALVAEETRVLSPTPQTLIGFIDHICRGAYMTDAARATFGDNLQRLRAQAEQDSSETIYYWS